MKANWLEAINKPEAKQNVSDSNKERRMRPQFNLAPLLNLFRFAKNTPTQSNGHIDACLTKGEQNRHQKTAGRREIPTVSMESLNPRRPVVLIKIRKSAVINMYSGFFQDQSRVSPARITAPTFCIRCNTIVDGQHVLCYA
ncbi:hypothetical protein SNE40_022732 [Patella caerulea]|uniref:Uncharacterized protein n=1 Tax=Patella caerulea TaxID=87958 RepID=A0AAN8GBB0_PATCE